MNISENIDLFFREAVTDTIKFHFSAFSVLIKMQVITLTTPGHFGRFMLPAELQLPELLRMKQASYNKGVYCLL